MESVISRRRIIRRVIHILEPWWQALYWQDSRCKCRWTHFCSALTLYSMLWIVTTDILLLDLRKCLADHENTSSPRIQTSTFNPTQFTPRRTEPWGDLSTVLLQVHTSSSHTQPTTVELPQMSSPRTEAWEYNATAPPRSGPEPVLPESIDEDDTSSHYSRSTVSDEEDTEHTGDRREIIPNFRPQQAPYPTYNPYVRGMVIHQVPADRRSVGWHDRSTAIAAVSAT
jgi:hypothetical protein